MKTTSIRRVFGILSAGKTIRRLFAVVLACSSFAHGATFTVNTAADEFTTPSGTTVSLREALRDAPDGAGIVFDSALNGATLTLAAALGGEIVLGKSVTIDASNLPAGVTISGVGGTKRIFKMNSGATIALLGLTLTGGNGMGVGGGAAGAGGAIYMDPTAACTLTRCTLTANYAFQGGAIFNIGGSLALTHCPLSGNASTTSGGAILGSATLTHCTLAGNTAGNSGGAIAAGVVVLTHCTVAGNSAGLNGGGVSVTSGPTLVLNNSIVAGNMLAGAGSGADIRNDGGSSGVTLLGANLVQSFTGTAAIGTGTMNNAAPLLAPLGNYGGPTQTMALLPGSPARDAASALSPAITSDQRGFPIVGAPDIGAYEAGTLGTNYNAWIYETLPATATPAQHATTFDYDNDGQTNLDEFNIQTSAASAASFFQPASFVNASGLNITFPTATGRNYRLRQSDTLSGWIDTPGQALKTGNGSPQTFTIPQTAVRRFYQVIPLVP